jgi:uncharacterized MAPEG superfamily protein
MTTPTVLALTGFIAWTLLLLILMELIRVKLVLVDRVPPTGFRPDTAGLSPFMQRLARAHANCLEGLPIFGGLLLVAIATDRQVVTDPLAYWLLAARLLQSGVHLASVGALAINLRFAAFAAQMAIGATWAWGLLRPAF